MLHSTHCSPKNLFPIDRKKENQGKKTLKNTLRKILKGNGIFFLLTIAALLLYLRFDLFYIKTGSMEPALPIGSIVVVDPVAEPEIGDIFAYRAGTMVVIHRIIAKDGNNYTFKGDANASPDISPVAGEQILGKVTIKLTFPARIAKWFIRNG